MKIDLIDICSGIAGFIAPSSLIKNVYGISEMTSLLIISIICSYGAIHMMRAATGSHNDSL